MHLRVNSPKRLHLYWVGKPVSSIDALPRLLKIYSLFYIDDASNCSILTCKCTKTDSLSLNLFCWSETNSQKHILSLKSKVSFLQEISSNLCMRSRWEKINATMCRYFSFPLLCIKKRKDSHLLREDDVRY